MANEKKEKIHARAWKGPLLDRLRELAADPGNNINKIVAILNQEFFPPKKLQFEPSDLKKAAARFGVSFYHMLWAEETEAAFRTVYPRYEDIAQTVQVMNWLFPGKRFTEHAIRKQGAKLGLRKPRKQFRWTADVLAKLEALVAEGLSKAEIAKRLNQHFQPSPPFTAGSVEKKITRLQEDRGERLTGRRKVGGVPRNRS